MGSRAQSFWIQTGCLSTAPMQFSGFNLGAKTSKGSARAVCFPGVHGAVDPLRSISNSVVKRSSGNDSWRVASCENSSMPGQTLLYDDAPDRSLMAAIGGVFVWLGCGSVVHLIVVDQMWPGYARSSK